MSEKKLTFENAPGFVKTSEAAQLLNVHLTTIQRWIKEGRLDAERLPDSNRWRVRTDDLKAIVGYQDPDPDRLNELIARLPGTLDRLADEINELEIMTGQMGDRLETAHRHLKELRLLHDNLTNEVK